MSLLHFYKYQATGNDFILIDNRNKEYSLSADKIAQVCHRQLGIGADGLVLIGRHSDANFSITYYNRDGTLGSLCGNGCRATVALASRLKIIDEQASFIAFDGLHKATILNNNQIRLKINDVCIIKRMHDDWFINTGSPHYIRFVTHLNEYHVLTEGRKIRYSNALQPDGANINFAELLPSNTIAIRTYERGVETETLSCGTGTVATVLASSSLGYHSPVVVQTRGGQLIVEFTTSKTQVFSHIFLTGPAKIVFEGSIEL